MAPRPVKGTDWLGPWWAPAAGWSDSARKSEINITPERAFPDPRILCYGPSSLFFAFIISHYNL